MGKLIRGVLIYSIVLLAIGVVVAAIAIGAMFFTSSAPSPFAPFGYRFVSETNQKYLDGYLNTETLNNGTEITINVDAGGFPVRVESDKNNLNKNVVVEKNDHLFGVVKGKYNPELEISRVEGTNTFNIKAQTLNGWVTYTNSYVLINVPTVKQFVYDFNIKTTSGSVTIDGLVTKKDKDALVYDSEKSIKISDLKIETENGKIEVKNLGSLNSLLRDGVTTHSVSNTVAENGVDKTTVTPLNIYAESITLKTGKGMFDFSTIENLLVKRVSNEKKPSGIFIQGKRADVKFNNIYAPITVNVDDLKIVASLIDTIGKGLDYNTPAGYLMVDKIVTYKLSDSDIEPLNNIKTTKTNINVNEIQGNTFISTKHGNISIKNLIGDSDLYSEHGSINIGHTNGTMEAESVYGNITISSYTKSISFKTRKGHVSATFSGVETDNVFVNALSREGGNITLNNLKHKVNITTEQNANVNLNIPSGTPFNVLFNGDLDNVRGHIAPTDMKETLKVNEVVSYLNATSVHPVFTINLAKGILTFNEII